METVQCTADCTADLTKVFLPRLRISSCWNLLEEIGWQKRDIQHIKKSKVKDPLQISECRTWWLDFPFGIQRSWLNPCSRSAPLHNMNPGSCLPQHSVRRAGPKGKRGRRTAYTGVTDLWLEFGMGWQHWEESGIILPSGDLLYSQYSLWK